MELNAILKSSVADINVKTGEATTTLMAMDVGSTETRFINFDKQGNLSDIVPIASDFGIVGKDISYIASPDTTIAGNFEAIIKDETASAKTEPQFTEVRLAKGKLLRSLGASTQRTTANASKIDQQPTYINIIFNVALGIALKGIDTHSMPSFSTVDLTVSLPPEDTTSQARMDLFRSRLAGTYFVQFPRLKIAARFEIKESDIYVCAESNAVATCIAMNDDANMEDDDVIAFIDIGGRSAGNSFILNGTLVEDRCNTTPYGGLMMLNEIAQAVADKYNIQPPAMNMVEAALSTGQIKIGNRRMDISDCITAAKETIARPIFDDFMRALDNNHLQAQQVARIYCSGRTFGTSKNENGQIISTSIMTMLESMYKTRSPYTEFIAVPETYPIVTGLVFMRFGKFDA